MLRFPNTPLSKGGRCDARMAPHGTRTWCHGLEDTAGGSVPMSPLRVLCVVLLPDYTLMVTA